MQRVVPPPLGDHALADLVRASGNAITAMAPDGIVTAWNPAAERLYGYGESEALGRHIDMLVPDDRREEAAELLARLAAGERVEHFETRRRTKDGTIVDVTLSASVARGPDGEVAGFFASSREIGFEKRLRERLERSEAQLETAQELTAVGSWEFRLADRALGWSRGLYRLTGQDPDRFHPTAAASLELLHPEDRGRVLATIARAVDRRGTFACQARVRRPDGDERLLDARGRVIPDEDGRPASIVGSAQDVTDAAAARRALQSAEERFRTAFAEAPIGMALLDLEGRYLEVNAALCELLGRSIDELVGTSRGEGMHPDDVAEAERGLAELIAGAISAHTAQTRYVAGGREIRTASRVVLVREASGEPRRFLCQVHDVTDRHRAEAALRTSEARFRAILDAMPATVFVKDLEGRYTLVNRSFEELVGLPAEALIGRSADAVVDGATAERMRTAAEEVLTRLEPETVEELVPVDGEPRSFETSVFPLLDELGRPYALGGVAVDVTDRRRQHDELARSRALLQEAQRIGRVGSWSWELATGQVTWSEEQFRIYGMEPHGEPLSYDEANGPVHPDDRAHLQAVVNRALEDGEAFSELHRIVRPDGSTRVLRARGEVRTGPSGEPVRMIGTVQDVTQELEREEAILELARRNRLILDSVGEGICGIDRDGRVMFVNAAGTRLLGRSEAELVGEHLSALEPHGDPTVLSAMRTGDASEMVWRPGGAGVALELRRHPMRAGGELLGAVITLRDVGERERAREELEATLLRLREVGEDRRRLLAHLVTVQEDERRRIAADIHDDSVQAMSAVALELEAIRARLPAGERRLAAVDRLHESVLAAVDRLRALLFELAPPELEQGGLGAALRALLGQLARDAGVGHDIQENLVAEPSAECRLIVYRIAQEAVVNVRKHARAGWVWARLESRDGGIGLEIRDDGVGFDADPARPVPGHLGILSMTHRAQLAGGRLEVASAPGAGTTVSVWVPEPA